MNEKKIFIEKVNAPEVFNTVKYRMEDAGIFVASPEVIGGVLQFKFSVGDKTGIIRIEELKDYGITIDLSLVKFSELESLFRQMISDVIGRDLTEEDGVIATTYKLNSSDVVFGMDEAGTGDYFGPVVISGVLTSHGDTEGLTNLGLTDVRHSDYETVKKIAEKITQRYHTVTVILSPELYNEMFLRHKDINLILLKAHIRAIHVAQNKHEIDVVIIDRFGEKDLSTEVAGSGKLRIIHSFSSSKHPTVLAASILSRAVYFREIDALNDEYRIKFVRGTGDEVVSVAKSFIISYGLENLFRTAKVNFRLTGNLL